MCEHKFRKHKLPLPSKTKKYADNKECSHKTKVSGQTLV